MTSSVTWQMFIMEVGGPFAAAIGERIRVFDSIGPQGAPKVAREFWIEQQEAPFMYGGVTIQPSE